MDVVFPIDGAQVKPPFPSSDIDDTRHPKFIERRRGGVWSLVFTKGKTEGRMIELDDRVEKLT